MTVVEQKPVTMAELKDRFDAIKKEKKELNFRAEKVYSYLQEFVSLKKKQADELHKKISELEISRLRERHIVKIIDVMPEDVDSLKSLFVGEAISLKPDDMTKILKILND